MRPISFRNKELKLFLTTLSLSLHKTNEMLVKEKVLETIRSLPDEFSLDELVERLILLEKINTGLQEVEEGKVVSQEEAKERMKKWQK